MNAEQQIQNFHRGMSFLDTGLSNIFFEMGYFVCSPSIKCPMALALLQMPGLVAPYDLE